MNELIWEAGMEEYRLRQRLRQARDQTRREALAGMKMLPLFGDISDPPPMERTRPSKEEVADAILRQAQGHRLTRKQLYEAMADEPFFASEINAALTLLKKQKRASYTSPLGKNSVIDFSSPPTRG